MIPSLELPEPADNEPYPDPEAFEKAILDQRASDTLPNSSSYALFTGHTGETDSRYEMSSRPSVSPFSI